MPAPVYRVLGLLCGLVESLPIGTNLGLVHLCWMMLSGQLLVSRGAIFPGLMGIGLAEPAVRRAWVALGNGRWTSGKLVQAWASVVTAEGVWHPHRYGGYCPVAVDITGFERPRLRTCPTTHYNAVAGKALPAIPLGIVARVGSVGEQREGGTRSRLGLPLGVVRADPADPSPSAHLQALLKQAVRLQDHRDVLVTDREFTPGEHQKAGSKVYVTRARKNFTAQRAEPREYQGQGRRPLHGEVVRPLARQRKGQVLPATPPDHECRWREGERDLRAEEWTALVLPGARPGSPTFRAVAIYDPAYTGPLLLVTPLDLVPRALRAVYRDRWPVEQIPLSAKQMLGLTRQFVHAEETCQRWPELALVAGVVLTYAAATGPVVPTGSWDRQPKPTPGRLRRVLAKVVFPKEYPLPERIRVKQAKTTHLPKGDFGQRRRSTPTPGISRRSDQPNPALQSA